MSAQKDLDNAVAAFLTSPEWTEDHDPGVLTGYVLVTAEAVLNEGSGGATGYSYVSLGNDQPLHVSVGLLKLGLDKYEAEAMSD